jgi:hypothetical protein
MQMECLSGVQVATKLVYNTPYSDPNYLIFHLPPFA